MPLPVDPYAKSRQFSPFFKKSRTSGKVVERKKAACDSVCSRRLRSAAVNVGYVGDTRGVELDPTPEGKTEVNLYRVPYVDGSGA